MQIAQTEGLTKSFFHFSELACRHTVHIQGGPIWEYQQVNGHAQINQSLCCKGSSKCHAERTQLQLTSYPEMKRSRLLSSLSVMSEGNPVTNTVRTSSGL